MDPKLEILNKLLSVFTLEQLQLVADSVVRAKEIGASRRCIQSVRIDFNDKGYPRYISNPDTLPFPAPAKNYSPE